MLLLAVPALGHRLDEYLQGSLIAIEKHRVEVQMNLTPGVAIFPRLAAEIDLNADGMISEIEQRAYAGRVLSDLTMAMDGRPLTPRVVSMKFPAIGDLKEGRGEIQIVLDAEFSRGRRLTIENRHQPHIAAYQVNALVPSDPALRIVAQKRNYSQSQYEVEFAEAGTRSAAAPLGAAVLLVAGVALFYRRRAA